MLLKIVNKSFIRKVISVSLIIYMILLMSGISMAESYEWTLINNMDSVETNAITEGGNSIAENADKIAKDKQNLQCESAILIEQNSGQILYEKNMHEQLRPASVTKVMTVLLIFEALESRQISLEDKVPCSENAASMGGSQIWLDSREELTVNEMLKAITITSANDCTVQFRHK